MTLISWSRDGINEIQYILTFVLYIYYSFIGIMIYNTYSIVNRSETVPIVGKYVKSGDVVKMQI